MQQQTAILIFTRSVQEEAQQKWFSATTNSRRIAQSLLSHTRRIANSTGYPVIEISSQQQQGYSFGQRLGHAINNIWQRGFEQVLVVGTDTPQLSTKLLLQAAERLSPSNSVLGAATDGGAYLIGLHRRHFQAAAFIALPWQQANLYSALQAQLSQTANSLHQLPVLADLDDWKDLVEFVQTTPWSLLRFCLRAYLLPREQRTNLLLVLQAYKKTFATPMYNRPPPNGTCFFA